MAAKDAAASLTRTCVRSHDAANCAEAFDGVLHVSVDADGVERDGDAGTVAGDDDAFAGEHRCLIRCFVDAEQRSRVAAGDEVVRPGDGMRHRISVAVVAAACDVRGRDQRPDLRFVRSAFAEVCAEIDHNSVPFVSGSSHTSPPPTAKKSAAQVMTTAKLWPFDAAPIAKGAAADASRPPL